MSEVNADGVLMNPKKASLQQVQGLTNNLMAEDPEGMEESGRRRQTVVAGNGQPAGTVGGAPHFPVPHKHP